VIATFDFGAAHNQILSDPEHGIFVLIPPFGGVPGLNKLQYEVGEEKYNRAACGVWDWSVIKAAQEKNEHLNDHLRDKLWSDEINIVIYDAVNQVNNRQIINYNFP
jgi:hypothetical protein